MSGENYQETVSTDTIGGAEVSNPAWKVPPQPPTQMTAKGKPLPVPVPEGYGLPPLAGKTQLWVMRHWWELPVLLMVLSWMVVGIAIFLGLLAAFFEALGKNGHAPDAMNFIGGVFWSGVGFTGLMGLIIIVGFAVLRQRSNNRQKSGATTPSNFYEVAQHNDKLVKNFFAQLRARKTMTAASYFAAPQVETLQKFISDRPFLNEMRYVRVVAQYPHLSEKSVMMYGTIERPGYSAPFQAHLVAANHPDRFLIDSIQVEDVRPDKHTGNKTQFFGAVVVLMAIALGVALNSNWLGGLVMAVIVGALSYFQYRRLY